MDVTAGTLVTPRAEEVTVGEEAAVEVLIRVVDTEIGIADVETGAGTDITAEEVTFPVDAAPP